MGAGFRVVQSSLVCLWDEMLSMIGANLVWFAASLPLFALIWLAFPWPLAAMLYFLWVLAPNPLAGGVHLVASRVVQGEGAEFGLVWRGLKRNFGKALIVFIIDCVLFAIILANVGFYFASANNLVRIIGVLWLSVLVLWLGIQVYLYPFLLMRPDKGIWPLFRDSLFLTLANPVLTMTVLAFVVLAIFLSAMLGLAVPLLLMAFVAVLENQAMATMAEKYMGQKVKQNGATK